MELQEQYEKALRMWQRLCELNKEPQYCDYFNFEILRQVFPELYAADYRAIPGGKMESTQESRLKRFLDGDEPLFKIMLSVDNPEEELILYADGEISGAKNVLRRDEFFVANAIPEFIKLLADVKNQWKPQDLQEAGVTKPRKRR